MILMISAVDDVLCGGGGGGGGRGDDDVLGVTSSSRALIVSNSPPTDTLIILAQPVAEDVESENSNTESHDSIRYNNDGLFTISALYLCNT